MPCAPSYINWRYNVHTDTSSASGADWGTDGSTSAATGTGTTTTLTWDTSDSPLVRYATGTTTCSSAGQTYQWARCGMAARGGPTRRVGGYGYAYTRERIGTGELNNSSFLYTGPRASALERRRRKAEQAMRKAAVDKSLVLLRSWLSDLEYHYLMEQGQLELPSQYEKDTIYIVKKDPNSRVGIAKKRKVSCIAQLPIQPVGEACINIDSAYPVGDSLLSKIALLKTDEKAFLDIANIDYYPPPRPQHTVYTGPVTHIPRVRGSNFWFVQLNERGQCDTAYETDRHIQFQHINHEEIPSPSVAIGNDIIVPEARQYFIWELAMIPAVNRARKMFRERRNRFRIREAGPARTIPTANGEMVTLRLIGE